MKRFYIHTLGCPKNQVDSSSLSSLLVKGGFIETSGPEEADVILINTCGFINEAKEESIEHILVLLNRKEPWQKVVVFGCLAQRYMGELKKELPEVEGVFGVDSFKEIMDFLNLSDKNKEVSYKRLSYKKNDSSYAYIKIAEGCNRRCTFCVIPSIRGRLRSYTPESILEEAERLVRKGVKEIILVAQDITSYGMDIGNYRLVRLLREIASIEGDFWIRLLYLYPTMIDEALIETIADVDKVCKYLDIPIQHSEERILRLMGRAGSSELFRRLIKRLRQDIPDVVLRTTVIVGFPSESDEEFSRLLDFIKEMEFDRLGAFRYSPEEGTEAYKIKEQIPEEKKQERFHEVMKAQAEISYRKNKELLNRRFRVLIDDVSEDLIAGRYYGQAPEIDGIVIIDSYVSKSLSVLKQPRSEDRIKTGDFLEVRITEAYDYDLKAILL
jgi:ribosomal protein S12 methylthiotransferase